MSCWRSQGQSASYYRKAPDGRQTSPKSALMPLGTPSPASRRRKHASVQFGAKKIARWRSSGNTFVRDPSRDLKQPPRALGGAGPARPGGAERDGA